MHTTYRNRIAALIADISRDAALDPTGALARAVKHLDRAEFELEKSSRKTGLHVYIHQDEKTARTQ